MKKIFGGKIITELCYKPEEAIKQKKSLYDFSSQFTIASLKPWMEHMKSKGVPFLIIDRKGLSAQDKRRFVLLKRQFFWDAKKKFVPKRCKCDPIDGDMCPLCKPDQLYNRNSARRAA